jgi:hypothetical protein
VVVCAVQPVSPYRLPLRPHLPHLPIPHVKAKLPVRVPVAQTFRQLPEPEHAEHAIILAIADGHGQPNPGPNNKQTGEHPNPARRPRHRHAGHQHRPVRVPSPHRVAKQNGLSASVPVEIEDVPECRVPGGEQ